MWLSVVLAVVCLVAAFYVLYPFLLEKFEYLASMEAFVERSKDVMALLSFIIGLWSLLKYNIVGDFFPAVAAMISGLLLGTSLFDYVNFSADSELSQQRKLRVQEKLRAYSVMIGFACAVLGLIHLIDLFFGGKSLFI